MVKKIFAKVLYFKNLLKINIAIYVVMDNKSENMKKFN